MSSSAVAAVRSLDRPDAGWFLSLYPAAGEAGGSFVPRCGRLGRGCRLVMPLIRSGRGSEAARRARAKVRRYCAANRLNRLGTLTYRGDGCHDPRQVRRRRGGVLPALRCELRGRAFPYVWVPEWHKTEHGLHVHFAVGQFIATVDDRGGVGSRVRAHQAAVRSAGGLDVAARGAPGGGVSVEVRHQVLRGR